MLADVFMLAHQGGWDEILLVVGPIVVIFGALWVAKRRADALGAGRKSGEQPSGTASESHDETTGGQPTRHA